MFRTVILSGIPLFLSLTMAFIPASTLAGEHPSEHPQEHAAEHPETKSVGMTKEALAQAISGYVQKETKLKGGYFLVYDRAAKSPACSHPGARARRTPGNGERGNLFCLRGFQGSRQPGL